MTEANSPLATTHITRRFLTPRSLIKLLIFTLVLVLSILFGGFLVFAQKISSLSPPAAIPQADGIVVLTGTGGGRLEAGAKLLRQGKGERLLISGVNADFDRGTVVSMLGLPEELADCCVDFDYAEDTIANARETSQWVRAMSFEHIILVTSAYHMPRAQVEIAAATGRIRITSYPVASALPKAWWKDRKQIRRLAQEYGKLLISYAREPGDPDTRGTPPLQTPEQ